MSTPRHCRDVQYKNVYNVTLPRQELSTQLKEVMEQKLQTGMQVLELTKRLHELQKEQVLHHGYWIVLELQKAHKVTWNVFVVKLFIINPRKYTSNCWVANCVMGHLLLHDKS